MARTGYSPILRQIRRVCADPRLTCSTDQELLQRFLCQRDEAAFAALVHRHGPTVLGLCRGMLGNDTGKELWRHKPASRPLALAYAPDGQTLAMGSDTGVVRVHEAWTGTQRYEFTLKARPIVFVAFSPTGKLLAAGGGGGAVHLRDARDGREITALHSHLGWVRAASFSPDGQRLASGSGATETLVWDFSTFDR